MYKDKEKQREAVRKAVEKHRKGITSEGITEQGITWYPNKETDDDGSAITPVMLSDGQLWYPRQIIGMAGNDTELPDNIYLDIVRDSKKYGRFEERVEKALKYQELKLLEVTA